MNFFGMRGQIQAAAEPLGDGDAGVEQTVQQMVALIDRGKKDPDVRAAASQIIRWHDVKPFDFRGEYKALYEWVKRNVRWTRDATNKEVLQDAATTLRLRTGDCDDFSILLCSLLGATGARTRLVTISNHPEAPDEFSHIFPEIRVDGEWIAVDAGRRNPAWGRGPRSWFRRRHWDVDTGEFEEVDNVNYAHRSSLAGNFAHRSSLGASDARRLGRFFAHRSALGRYYAQRGALRGMGATGSPTYQASMHGRVRQFFGQDTSDSSWDWSQFETELPSLTTAVTTGTAKIITAENQPTIAASQYGALVTAAQIQAANPLASLTANPTALLLLGGVVVFALVMANRNH